MELCFVEIDDDNFIENEPVSYIATQSFRQTSAPLPATYSGEFTTMLPFRFYSMTALYARFRNISGAQGVTLSAGYRKSSSINPNFSQYYARIGAAMYPNKNVNLINGYLTGSGGEAYAELMKSFHSLSPITGDPAIRSTEYNVAATAYTNGQWSGPYLPNLKSTGNIDTFGNAFSIGFELQTFSNRSDTICSTQNTQLLFTGIISNGLLAGGTNTYSYTCDFFAQYDMILVIETGIMRAVF